MVNETCNYMKQAVTMLEELSLLEYKTGGKINKLAQQMLADGIPMTDEIISHVNALASACFAKSIQTYSKAEQVDAKYFNGDLLLLGEEDRNIS